MIVYKVKTMDIYNTFYVKFNKSLDKLERFYKVYIYIYN